MSTSTDYAKAVRRGDVVKFDENLGPRQVRQAKKAGPCSGWRESFSHTTIEVGDLYVETEMNPDKAGGFSMKRICLGCAGLRPRAVGDIELCQKCNQECEVKPSMLRSGARTCMKCQSKLATSWAHRNPEKHVQHIKDYYAKRPGLYASKLRAYRARNKEKIAAHGKVYLAVKSGALSRAECVICGNPKSYGHHDNYDRPLDVAWLCNFHHRERHISLGWGHV